MSAASDDIGRSQRKGRSQVGLSHTRIWFDRSQFIETWKSAGNARPENAQLKNDGRNCISRDFLDPSFSSPAFLGDPNVSLRQTDDCFCFVKKLAFTLFNVEGAFVSHAEVASCATQNIHDSNTQPTNRNTLYDLTALYTWLDDDDDDEGRINFSVDLKSTRKQS